MREKYRWAAAVPGRPEQAKCSLDGKLISVRNGAIQLGQHEKQKIHIDAAAALPRQPSIRNLLVSAVDNDSGRLRATFYHVVRIALDGSSNGSSNDRELLSHLRDKTFVVHLDQFIVHTTPIYSFTKEVQTPSLSLYGCLGKMLELIMKLLNRLGHSLILSPAGYVSNHPRSMSRNTNMYKLLWINYPNMILKPYNCSGHSTMSNSSINSSVSSFSDRSQMLYYI